MSRMFAFAPWFWISNVSVLKSGLCQFTWKKVPLAFAMYSNSIVNEFLCMGYFVAFVIYSLFLFICIPQSLSIDYFRFSSCFDYNVGINCIHINRALNCCSVSNPLIIFHVLVYLHCLVSKSMAKITTRPIITVCSKKWAKKVAKQKISITHICYERWARFLFPSHFSLPHAHFHAHTHPQSHLNIRKQINANNELIHFVIIPSN